MQPRRDIVAVFTGCLRVLDDFVPPQKPPPTAQASACYRCAVAACAIALYQGFAFSTSTSQPSTLRPRQRSFQYTLQGSSPSVGDFPLPIACSYDRCALPTSSPRLPSPTPTSPDRFPSPSLANAITMAGFLSKIKSAGTVRSFRLSHDLILPQGQSSTKYPCARLRQTIRLHADKMPPIALSRSSSQRCRREKELG